ncbi:2-oxoglutarate dehydrogenase E2 component (dihydrolipoamide succinyltransferase) [Phycicoccus badiiscoriae]|uniref:Dihydrolipoamide acetyltransferase component of pyruvate dehydrogenase complex n=1 Tax=Pedococcus badiiscoriae TaxID=642776 RepID=A0A852WAJ5_9MICO|nr:2-oxoglutarate dehydrogenase, E2 component, dihydrolipoamide succinyltransferase [Pedococcus badiiscoriae]NYG05640.1 2-oxoglutarate dehydrogenase E2 component (dihydrolipoamide succinyltransferase) [Pedococcus badiiscoriae]
MSERVTMPALGESVTEGTVTRWLKNVGDTVAVDEPLLEVSTDKVDTEIPSPVAGVLQEILAQEDDTVPVGADLAVIGDGSDGSGGGEQPAAQDGGQGEQGQQTEGQGEDQGEQALDGGQGEQAQQGAEAPPAEAPSTEQEPQAATSEPEQDQASGGGESGAGSDSSGSSGGETVKMPALGESVTEGTVTRWLKAEGDRVEVDEPLLEVSTDKVDTEIPSPVAGTLTKILVQEDDTVPVGGDLAVIGGSAGSAPAQEAPAQEAPAQEAPAAPAPAPQPAAQEAPAAAPSAPAAPAPAPAPAPSAPAASGTDDTDASAYVTPLVRKLAAENNIDLGSLKGTGVGGRIRKQDVLDAAKAAEEAAAAPAPAAPAAAAPAAAPAAASTGGGTPSVSPKRGTTEKMSRLRQTIAKRMVESLQVSAQLTTVVEVDVTKIARLRTKAKTEFERREGTKLSFLPFFALAAVEALKAHPSVNSSVEGTEVTYHGTENLGVAVDTERGLLVPVIKDAGDLNIAGLARKIADLAERTRTNKIGPDELGGGTFTLTNTGSRGALFDTPIINQPNVAILGTGAVVKRPVVVSDGDGGETIAVRSMVYLALSYDHRVVDGADAARFLTTMKTRLEDGNFESDLGL